MTSKHHSYDRGPGFAAAAILLFSITCVVVAFRIYARIKTKRQRLVLEGVGMDEYFGIIALILAGGITVDIALGIKYGMGRTILEKFENRSDFRHERKIVFSIIFLLRFCLTAVKMSILSLYLRLTPIQSHRLMIYIIMGIINAHLVAAVIGALLRCSPISRFWDVTEYIEGVAKCVDRLTFDIFNAAWDISWDFIICLLPLPIILRLNVSRARKVGLCVVVAVSGCSVICAIIRLLALISLTTAPDDRWSLPVIPFVSALEGYVALMTSSIPAIYPLVVKPKFNFRAPMMANIEQPPSDSCWHSKSNTMTSSARQQSDTSRWNLKPVSARPSISLAVTGVVNDGSGLPETRSESNQRKASVVASRKVDDTIFMAI